MIIRAVLAAGQELATPWGPPPPVGPAWLILSISFVLHGVVFVWQAVGVLRATETHMKSSGQMFRVWGAQVALVVGALWGLSYSLEAWHLTQPKPKISIPSQVELNAERAAKYRLSISESGRVLVLLGSLELGTTARLRAVLDVHPEITEIHLSSQGGNIYEARGLSEVIREHGLDTFVAIECSSACTTVFVGGAERNLMMGARLGFHQYRIDAGYAVLNAHPEREQARDRKLFEERGVADWFLEQMYQRDATDMWYPDSSVLIEAGVVTAVVDLDAQP